jgi:hypothetical protein
MLDGWGSTGIPDDNSGMPIVPKVRSLVAQDLALTQGNFMRGFAARQAELGFRQSTMLRRPPEVDVGALFDLGS